MTEFRKKIPKILIFPLFFLNFSFLNVQLNAQTSTSVINIENAQKSEYKKDAVTGDDCIVLTGDVRISVTKGNDKTVISADSVNYNRVTEMLFAEGNVSLSQSGSSSGGESITADSLLFNTGTLEGIFDNGRIVQTSSDALNLPSGSTLIVASNIFGRDSGGTIAFKAGELTFCDDENPHWKIKASRIWLLPGGEFAFLNAVLFVGVVPVMYFPAFYYPKDELIFNPAIGYKPREGYFINTTTYIYGRKPLDAATTSDLNSDEDDSTPDFFSFMKTSTLKEQVREGLVLHNLDEDYTGDTTNYAKIMADYYSNLGFLVGADVYFKPPKIFNSISANVQLGFSNTIFPDGNGNYIPFNASGEKVRDGSNFLSLELPFRYQANIAFSVSSPFNLSFSMPVYSDPYFSNDFSERAETMDWIGFLMSGSGDDDDDITSISSFTWNLSGSYTFKIPEFLNPYITSLSVSSLSSSILFSSKSNNLREREEYETGTSYSWQNYTPERSFYYPSQVTPFKISGRIAGTLVQYPPKSSSANSAQSVNINLTPEKQIDPNYTEEDEKTAENEENSALTAEESESETAEAEEEKSLPETMLPSLSVSAPSIKNLSAISYTLGYSVSPDFSSQISYSSSSMNTPEDFDWKNMQSTYLQVKAPAVLTSSLNLKDGFLSLTDTFTFNPVYQSHPYLNTDTDSGGYTESSANSIKRTDYNAKKLDLTNVNALTFKPFYYTDHFSGTSLTWNTTVKMIRTKYISEDIENPEWEYLTTDIWDDECVTTHNLNLVLSANQMSGKFSQELSLTSTLPPQDDEYRGVLTLKFPYTTFSVGTGIKQSSTDENEWEKQDLSQSLSFSLFSNAIRFTQSYVYDLEEDYTDSFKLSLSGYGVQLAYTMSYVAGYDFDNGWTVRQEKEFQPYSLSLAYASGTKNFKFLSEKISFAPSVSTSIVYDCLRPTNSYFKFIPSITFKINDVIDIKFSSESRNDVIFRYFQKLTPYGEIISGEQNPLLDLLDSFMFHDTSKREASGFKLQNLNIAVTHDLDDWDLNCEFTIKPRLITRNRTREYDFSPYFTISVSWRPMSSMKTEIRDEYGEWQLNP